MSNVTTFSQLQTTTARLASFVAAALFTVAEAISEIEVTDVSISNATTNQAGLMSAADKAKLDGIDTGAQVNAIENILIDGVNQSISNKNVTLDLSDYVKNTEIASVLIYCGSVNSFSNLPNNALIGDVYNVVTAGGTDANGTAIKAGDNVAYNGTGWDVLAGTVDLSGYVAKESGKGLSTNDFTTTEKNKLSGIAANAQANVIETVKVNNTALTPSNKAVNIDLSGYLKTTDKAASANTADTLTTRRVLTISDNSVTNTGPGVYFSGGANITIKMPENAIFNTLTATNFILSTTASTTEGAIWVEWS